MSKVEKQQSLIQQYLKELRLKSEEYHRHHQKYYAIDTVCDVMVALLNFLTVSGIFIGGIIDHKEGFVLGSAVISTLAGAILVLQRSVNFRGKYQSFQISSKQYSDLVRNLTMVITRNHLSGPDYERIITDLVHQLALIEDYTLPVTFHEPEDSHIKAEDFAIRVPTPPQDKKEGDKIP